MAYLVLVRHGQSEWNALGKWTGLHDTKLTEQGKAEARTAAEGLREITFDKAYTSSLTRTHETLHEILTHLDHAAVESVAHEALNERDYGVYTGKNKWQVRDEVGEEEFQKIRRSWEHNIPNGEDLKAVHARVMPYYEKHILADLKTGKNVIVAAHGNSLRALVKHLEDIPQSDIPLLEIATGEVYMYEINSDGHITAKRILKNTNE